MNFGGKPKPPPRSFLDTVVCLGFVHGLAFLLAITDMYSAVISFIVLDFLNFGF